MARAKSKGLTDCKTLQKPARWDHPTVPPNARSAADATDRTGGDILIEGVGRRLENLYLLYY